MSQIKVIDAERRRLDLSQRDLCRAAKVSASTYTRLKRGHTSGLERTFVRLRNALATFGLREAAE